MDQSFHDDDMRISDEENFADMKKRAEHALNFLEHRGLHEVCVVTHKVFLQMLIAYITAGKRLHAADYAKMSFFNPADNASIHLFLQPLGTLYEKPRMEGAVLQREVQ